MKYTFQHFLDISTSATSLNIISIKAGGEYVRQRAKHLFNAYKYYKLGAIKIKLIPASTLPVDPLGMSYDITDPTTIDPRDQLSPGLVRIVNGENYVSDLTGMDDTALEQMYTNTMLDPRWSKFMLQSGFSRYAYPVYWDVGMLKQSSYPDMVRNLPLTSEVFGNNITNCAVSDTVSQDSFYDEYGTPVVNPMGRVSDPRGLFQTGHRFKLGWLPTDNLEYMPYIHREKTEQGETTEVRVGETPMLNPIPSISTIVCILPKARKTQYYYRMFITETVYFKGLKNVGINVSDGGSQYEYRAIDNFTHCAYPEPINPASRKYDQHLGFGPQTPNDGGAGV